MTARVAPSPTATLERDYFAGFSAQYRRDKRLQSLGTSPRQAFDTWCMRRMGAAGSGRATPSRPAPGKAAPRLTHAQRLATLKRLAPAPTPKPAPHAWRYRASQAYIAHGLPGWPIFRAVRNTDTAPGTSTAWVLVGRAA